MASIPGPIIRFVVDAPGLSSAVTPAMQGLRTQAKATSDAIAAEWQQAAAKIRASIATGTATLKETTAEQTKLVGLLDREIATLRQRNELTNKELANLKAMTLERERQADAIKRGVGVGVTSGTSSALGQVSTQTVLGVERVLDSLVDRLFGGAAGAALRTVRDVQYYQNLASGGTGAAGAASGIFGLSGTTLGVLGGVAGVAAITAGLTAMSVKGGELAVEMTKLSEKTGLTVDETVRLRAASEALDTDFDKVTVGFRSLSKELVLASTADLPGASKAAKEAAAIFAALGVDAKKAAQDPFAAIQQLARAFASLPDGITKTTAATALFGRGGLEWIPVLEKLTPALNATAKSSRDLSNALTDGKSAKAMDDLRAQIVNFHQETEALEVALSKHLLPTLVTVVDWTNKIGSGIWSTLKGVGTSIAHEGRFGTWGPPPDWEGSVGYVGAPSKTLNEALGKTGDGAKEAAEATRKLSEEFKKYAEIADRVHAGLTEQQKFDQQVLRTIGPSLGINPALPTTITNANRQGIPAGGINFLTGQYIPAEYQSVGGVLIPPNPLGFGYPTLSGGIGNLSAPTLGAPGDVLSKYKSVVDEYVKETQSETDKVKAEFDDQLEYWKFIQSKFPEYAKQAQDAITKLQEEENKKLADLQQKQLEKYKQEADKLFDDLLSGNTKGFGKALQKDIENIVTEPFRKQFESLIEGIFGNLNHAINGGPAPTSASGWGSIFGGLIPSLGPGGTPGIFGGSLGLGGAGGRATGTVAIQTGQTGVATNTVYVQAGTVNVSGGSGSGASSIPFAPGLGSNLFNGAGFGTFFGNLNPFANAGFGGGLGLPSGGSGGLGGILSGNAGKILGGLIMAGAGVAGGGVPAVAMGAASVAAGLAGIFAGSSPAFGPTSGTQSLGGQLGGIFGGAGMLAAGVSQGGVGGTLSAAAGGAMIGTAILPGIGTAIGAIAGTIAGVISSIVGGPSWGQQVQAAMRRQAYNLPPSETFDFASNGSIASTLSTGFSQASGTFNQFQLPANTPFWANTIIGALTKAQTEQLEKEQEGINPNLPFLGFPSQNPYSGNGPNATGLPRGFQTGPQVSIALSLPGFIDAQSAAPVFARLGSVLSQVVVSNLGVASSAFGTNVRKAVALA